MTKQFKIIAVDDEYLSTRLIEKFSNDHELLNFAGAFNSSENAIAFIAEKDIDIVVLDIEMPEINGLEFAKMCPPNLKIIFSTAFDEFALEGFNLSAVDYLLKPYSPERFKIAVDKAVYLLNLEQKDKQNNQTEAQSIVVKTNYINQKLLLDDILYIESYDDYITIHLTSSEPIVVRKTMKRFLEEISNTRFLRIHRSYAIAIDKVDKFQKTKVFLGEKELPVSNQYKEVLMRYLG